MYLERISHTANELHLGATIILFTYSLPIAAIGTIRGAVTIEGDVDLSKTAQANIKAFFAKHGVSSPVKVPVSVLYEAGAKIRL